jgi:GNAT superfamily N-acetyltransferase
MSQFVVRPIETATDREGQLDLRYRVLREPLGLPKSAAAFAGDDAPDALHLIAVAENGTVIGCATVLSDGKSALQLRGMAVDEGWQGHGVGRAILEAVYADARARKKSLWCNARLSAEAFYARNGWVSEGDVFDVPGVGPHTVMHWTG